MKYEDALNKILEINQKFEKAKKENASELYFEVLHAYMVEIRSGITEEQFNELTIIFQQAINKLEKDLLDHCSMTYNENYVDYLKEHELFRKKSEENSQDKIKTVTRCKQEIGFKIRGDEEFKV